MILQILKLIDNCARRMMLQAGSLLILESWFLPLFFHVRTICVPYGSGLWESSKYFKDDQSYFSSIICLSRIFSIVIQFWWQRSPKRRCQVKFEESCLKWVLTFLDIIFPPLSSDQCVKRVNLLFAWSQNYKANRWRYCNNAKNSTKDSEACLKSHVCLVKI